jgi:L-ascorbate metabolism protein UlaG (beta-lactamase superfamily)
VVKGADRLRVSATPGRHGGPVTSILLPRVMGSILEFSNSAGSNSYRMYISGDTLVYDDIAEIPRRFPNIDLALLHLGGTRILGVLKVTMDGKDGVRMMRIIAPQRTIPIHYNDYDVFKSPLSDFEREVANAGLAEKVTYLKHGETYQFAPPRR